METRVFGQILSSFRSVLGVRINCDGLVQAHDTPRFEVITIESSEFRGRTSFRCGTQDSVTNHTGIVLQLGRDFQQGTRNHADLDKRNSISRLLSIPCDTESHDFGHYDPSLKVGNVIVIRADRKPLDVEYLEVLCEWIQNELRPRFEKARAECTRVDQLVFKEINRKIKQRTIRKKVLRRITKQNLLAYGRGRLRYEYTGDTRDVETAEVIENDDTSDDEMPNLGWY